MRDMSQLTVSLFECDCPLLQLLDQAGDAFIVNLACSAFLIARGLYPHCFLCHERYGSLDVEANKLLVGLTQLFG